MIQEGDLVYLFKDEHRNFLIKVQGGRLHTDLGFVELKKNILEKYKINDLSGNPDATKEFSKECYAISYTPEALSRLKLKTLKVLDTTPLETGHTIYTIEGQTFADTNVSLYIDAVLSDGTFKMFSVSEK